jgi:SHS2 domain-containing protein
VDHTGELELHVRAASAEAVFADASSALADVLGEAGGGPALERAVRVEAADRPALLAAWLSELVWLAEGESLIVVSVDALHVGATVAEGMVTVRSGRPRYLVKAVTYHGLTCESQEDGWRATVVLDV